MSDKTQFGSKLRRDIQSRNTAATHVQSNAKGESHSDLGPRVKPEKSARRNGQVATTSVREEIPPEVKDWLDRVVLPILKKVIFDD